MKLTIYCDKDLVLRYRPDGWPKEPKKVTEFESYAGTVYCGGDFGYEKAMNKYTEALQKAKYDSVPFEDQKQIWDLVCSYNAFTKHAQKDNFYDLEINGTVYIINNSHDGRSFAGINCSNRMTDNELIANNSIIDGFMGYKYYVGYGYNGDLYYDEAVIDPDESDFVQAPPHWHESWDWLMPVVEKIHSLKVSDAEYDEKTKTEFRKIREHVLSLPIHSPIDRVHDEVSKFAKWYNENKKA